MKFSHRIALVLPLALAAACHKEAPAPVYQAIPVGRRDIIVTAQASGAINPDTTVQVKSKASGEILDIKVSTGDLVKHGTLIVQVDPRIPQNDVAQAQAALQVDSATLANSQAQFNREKQMLAAKAVTQQEYESAQLAVSVANAAVIRDQISLENAKISLGDTQVLAPITGTVIEEAVQRGTVISSPTNSASGGTVILTMADLSLVQVKTWVDETDVGKLHPGQQANVIVAAYPNRPFKGEVLKIEPQGDTIQNVTMFPVDIRIDNRDNLLKPGMNADVTVAVGQRLGVLAVPVPALRTDKDVYSAGSVLGINQTDLQKMLGDAKKTFDDQMAQHSDSVPQAALPGPDSSAGAADAGAGAGSGRRGRRSGAAGDSTGGMGMGRRGNRGGDSTGGHGGRRGGNGGGNGGGNAESAGGNGGNGGNGGGNGGGFGGAGGGRRGGGRGGRAGGGIDYSLGGRYIVFVMKNGKPAPVYVQTGLTDLDYSEVKVGLAQGDSVLLLPSASLVQSQQQLQQRMSANAGLPGQTRPTSNAPAGGRGGAATPAGGSAGGGGGGRSGGGGGGGGGRGGR
ncbi:MAG TPA: efflux RND transporter periplasmic adaptor subunit [Gemmatimonadales bacterium]